MPGAATPTERADGLTDVDGVLDSRGLPDREFDELWETIVVPPALKTGLLGQGIPSFTLRPKVSASHLPLHGILLRIGPPGTGKTSLAPGLASGGACAGERLGARGHAGAFRTLESEPEVTEAERESACHRRRGHRGAPARARGRDRGCARGVARALRPALSALMISEPFTVGEPGHVRPISQSSTNMRER